jgi:muconolactone delta-isomerase
MGDIVDEHYGSADVAGEIARFSQGRWAAVYVEGRMKRYDNHGFLQIDSVEDFEKIYAKLRPRSFYATIHRYRWKTANQSRQYHLCLRGTSTSLGGSGSRHWELLGILCRSLKSSGLLNPLS